MSIPERMADGKRRVARRDRGMGSKPRKDKRGIWRANYYDALGQRRTVYGATEGACRKKLNEATREASLGELPASKLSLAAWCDEYLSTTNSLRDGTRRDYRTKLDCYVLPWLGRAPLASLGPADIRVWLGRLSRTTSKRTGREYSADTQRGAYNVLRIMLQAAQRERKVQTVATDGARLPTGRVRTDHWTVEQVESFRRCLHENNDRLAPLFETTVGIGLRQGEALGLTWPQVHLDDEAEPYIVLKRQLRRGTGELRPTKGGDEDTEDIIVLPSFVAEALHQQRTRQEAERSAAGRGWRNHLDLVFTTPKGTSIDGSNLTKIFHRRTRLAGLPQIRFHDLRHTTGATLRTLGVPREVIQQLLRHRDLRTTEKYTHPDGRDETRRAATALNGVLR
jgi:integrase